MSTLDELERLEKAATPGPWYLFFAKTLDGEEFDGISSAGGGVVSNPQRYHLDEPYIKRPDAALIAAARNALSELIKIAKAVAAGDGQACGGLEGHEVWCEFCRAHAPYLSQGKVDHEPDCAWLLARKLAGAQ